MVIRTPCEDIPVQTWSECKNSRLRCYEYASLVVRNELDIMGEKRRKLSIVGDLKFQ